eukprot:7050602-Pyramimonas_sp.AAC.1
MEFKTLEQYEMDEDEDGPMADDEWQGPKVCFSILACSMGEALSPPASHRVPLGTATHGRTAPPPLPPAQLASNETQR